MRHIQRRTDCRQHEEYQRQQWRSLLLRRRFKLRHPVYIRVNALLQLVRLREAEAAVMQLLASGRKLRERGIMLITAPLQLCTTAVKALKRFLALTAAALVDLRLKRRTALTRLRKLLFKALFLIHRVLHLLKLCPVIVHAQFKLRQCAAAIILSLALPRLKPLIGLGIRAVLIPGRDYGVYALFKLLAPRDGYRALCDKRTAAEHIL